MNVGDRISVSVLALEIVKLIFNSQVVVLSDGHFCPLFLLNVISIGFLAKKNYEISIKNSSCNVILNDVTMMNG